MQLLIALLTQYACTTFVHMHGMVWDRLMEGAGTGMSAGPDGRC